jgi:hypothetical protein
MPLIKVGSRFGKPTVRMTPQMRRGALSSRGYLVRGVRSKKRRNVFR